MTLDGFPVLPGDKLHHFHYGLCTVLRVNSDDAIVITPESHEVAMTLDKAWTWHSVAYIRPPKCSALEWKKFIDVALILRNTFL